MYKSFDKNVWVCKECMWMSIKRGELIWNEEDYPVWNVVCSFVPISG